MGKSDKCRFPDLSISFCKVYPEMEENSEELRDLFHRIETVCRIETLVQAFNFDLNIQVHIHSVGLETCLTSFSITLN